MPDGARRPRPYYPRFLPYFQPRARGVNVPYLVIGTGLLGIGGYLAWQLWGPGVDGTEIRNLGILRWASDYDEPRYGEDLDLHVNFEYKNDTGDTTWYVYGFLYPHGEVPEGPPDWAAFGEFTIDGDTGGEWHTKDDEEARHDLNADKDGIDTDGSLHGEIGSKDLYIEIWSRRKELLGSELRGNIKVEDALAITLSVKDVTVDHWGIT